MNSIYRVLLFGGLFILTSQIVYSKTLLSDVFVYKVSNEVSSLNDLKGRKTLLETLKCLYPESILAIQFQDLLSLSDRVFQSDKLDMNKVDQSLDKTFQRFILLSKLNQYVESHNIVINESLSKAFYVASQTDCNKINIFKTKDTFSDEFKVMISTEIFLRKRFLNDKKTKYPQKIEYKKAVKAIDGLLLSIGTQVNSEIYWSR